MTESMKMQKKKETTLSKISKIKKTSNNITPPPKKKIQTPQKKIQTPYNSNLNSLSLSEEQKDIDQVLKEAKINTHFNFTPRAKTPLIDELYTEEEFLSHQSSLLTNDDNNPHKLTKLKPTLRNMREADNIPALSLTLPQLEQLKVEFSIFEKSGGLDMECFLSAFLKIIGGKQTYSDKELSLMFMKIDANSDGKVDWDEFCSFILQENKAKDTMMQQWVFSSRCISGYSFDEKKIDDHKQHLYINIFSHFLDPADNQPYRHENMIDKIILLPEQNRYLTSSRDNSFRLWSASTLLHVHTVWTGHSASSQSNNQLSYEQKMPTAFRYKYDTAKKKQNYIQDVVYLPRYNMIAVSTIACHITFYEGNFFQPQHRYGERHVKGLPLCMSVSESSDKTSLYIGFDNGNITILTFSEGWHLCDGVGVNSSDVDYLPPLPCRHPLPGRIRHVSIRTIKHIHQDWIRQILYIPTISSLVSCSLDSYVKILDLDRFQSEQYQKVFTGHSKAVFAFDYCVSQGFIGSIGLEKIILIWDPNTCDIICSLAGHVSPLQSIIFNDEQYQIISLSQEKTIKVWDIRNFKCIHTITDENHYTPEDQITAICYDYFNDRLITGTNRLHFWNLKNVTYGHDNSHEYPLIGALFNDNFHQVVSVDMGSEVSIWDIATGEHIFKFLDQDKVTQQRNKTTAISFDAMKRRIITGSSDGTLRMYNYNGQCLNEFIDDSEESTFLDKKKQIIDEFRKEVSSIVYILEGRNEIAKTKSIVSVGWDRTIKVWPDLTKDRKRITPRLFMPKEKERSGNIIGHYDDILSVVACSPNIVATCGSDGQIFIWSYTVGTLKSKMNINDPNFHTKPDVQKAFTKLLWLPKHENLVSGGADGYVRFFDIITEQEIYYFKIYDQDEINIPFVSCLACDSNFKYLFTGDSFGNIKNWDLEKFSVAKVSVLQLKKQFNEDLIKLISSWTAHSSTIVSLDWVPEYQLLLTASTDHCVKLFTKDGLHIGTFGQSEFWDLEDRSTWKCVQKLGTIEKDEDIKNQVIGKKIDKLEINTSDDEELINAENEDLDDRSIYRQIVQNTISKVDPISGDRSIRWYGRLHRYQNLQLKSPDFIKKTTTPTNSQKIETSIHQLSIYNMNYVPSVAVSDN